MLFPWIEIIDSQSEMVIFVARKEGRAKVSYEMQFLVCSETEPRSGKGKCRTRNRFEFEDELVKVAASLDIGDVDRDVIEFFDCHIVEIRLSVNFGRALPLTPTLSLGERENCVRLS